MVLSVIHLSVVECIQAWKGVSGGTSTLASIKGQTGTGRVGGVSSTLTSSKGAPGTGRVGGGGMRVFLAMGWVEPLLLLGPPVFFSLVTASTVLDGLNNNGARPGHGFDCGSGADGVGATAVG